MLLGLLPKDQDEERNKRTNSDVGLVVRTTVGWYNPPCPTELLKWEKNSGMLLRISYLYYNPRDAINMYKMNI